MTEQELLQQGANNQPDIKEDVKESVEEDKEDLDSVPERLSIVQDHPVEDAAKNNG